MSRPAVQTVQELIAKSNAQRGKVVPLARTWPVVETQTSAAVHGRNCDKESVTPEEPPPPRSRSRRLQKRLANRKGPTAAAAEPAPTREHASMLAAIARQSWFAFSAMAARLGSSPHFSQSPWWLQHDVILSELTQKVQAFERRRPERERLVGKLNEERTSYLNELTKEMQAFERRRPERERLVSQLDAKHTALETPPEGWHWSFDVLTGETAEWWKRTEWWKKRPEWSDGIHTSGALPKSTGLIYELADQSMLANQLEPEDALHGYKDSTINWQLSGAQHGWVKVDVSWGN